MKRDTKTKAFKTKFSLKQKSQTVDFPPPPKKNLRIDMVSDT